MTDPQHVAAAATHPDTYPYYAGLARRGISRDASPGPWIAASAEAVTAVLGSDACRVRPSAEPVPPALLGTAAGGVFRRLVRMTDGPAHRPLKDAVASALASADESRLRELSREHARELVAGRRGDDCPIDDLSHRLPAYVLASLLGVPRPRLAETAVWAGDIARCFAPGAGTREAEAGAAAARALVALFGDLLRERSTTAATGDDLLSRLEIEARRAGIGDEEIVVANAIGFLTQAYDAAAGLIGNTLLALAAHPELRGRVAQDADALDAVLDEVLRHDPPVQNTRRFVSHATTIAGREMREGDEVVVVLAAANRDPAAHPCPERFEISRGEGHGVAFGSGAHACPGSAIAKTIARAAVEKVLASGADLARLAPSARYRPSLNTRVPLFGSADAQGGGR